MRWACCVAAVALDGGGIGLHRRPGESKGRSYVETDKVGLSTDVSGCVKQIDVGKTKTGEARPDLVPPGRCCRFRSPERGRRAGSGSFRNDLNALKAEHVYACAIQQPRTDIEIIDAELRRSRILRPRESRRRDLRHGATKFFRTRIRRWPRSKRRLAAFAAHLNGEPEFPVEQHPSYRVTRGARDEAPGRSTNRRWKAPFAGFVPNVPALAPGKYCSSR